VADKEVFELVLNAEKDIAVAFCCDKKSQVEVDYVTVNDRKIY